ncbi:MAG: ABC transporter permease [Planctomycetota bacterium]
MLLRNPVLSAELRRAYRSPRVFFSRAAFALALMVVLSLGFKNLTATQDTGRIFFYMVALTEAALAFLTAPAFCAGALAGERRAGTLGVLLTSGLRQRDIVFGKLFGRSALVALMILAAAPVLAVSLFAGGVSPFEVIATSSLALSGAILLSSIALYAAAAGAGFFGALLAAYLGFLLLEVGGACCIAIPGSILGQATAGSAQFMAGSHVLSLGILYNSPQNYGWAALLLTVGISLTASMGLGWLGAKHLQINELPPLPPPPPRPTKPGKKKKLKQRGALGRAPLFWLEQRGTAVEFLIVPALLALYGLFVLGLLLLNDPESLREPGLQYGALCAAGGLMSALLIITGAASFARDHEDKIANQLLCTPLTAWQFLAERFTAMLYKLWAFTALPFAMVVGLALLGGPLQGPNAILVLACLAAGAVISFATGALFGLRQRRRGPAVSWALSTAVLYWALAPIFVALSALEGNPVAEWMARAGNPFRVMYDALLLEDGMLTAAIGTLLLALVALALCGYITRSFGTLAGRVE